MPSPARDDDNDAPTGTHPGGLGYTAADDGDVCHHGRPLALPPKERAVLHLLLRQWPRTVSKEQFARQVWAGQPMSDESLARCIAQLRQALPPATGLALRAVYRRGYRLEVIASTNEAPSPAHGRLAHAAMAAPHQVETLTHARQLVQQRTAEALVRAERLLRALIDEAPDYLAAPLALAECLAATVSCGLAVRRERIDEALAHLDRVAHGAPHMPGLWAESAHLLDCAWRFDEAAALHERALASSPLDAATHYYRGWHLLATDRPREAVAALEQALRLNPFSVYMAILLARALRHRGRPRSRARAGPAHARERARAPRRRLAPAGRAGPGGALARTGRPGPRAAARPGRVGLRRVHAGLCARALRRGRRGRARDRRHPAGQSERAGHPRRGARAAGPPR
ncbi:winged helix-turn-helix domain-containing protein [Hydrogenophaga sp. UC242_53]|uniref:winged helix-turn-helix domain-containing protein n=1 Tax=Hydrogenophaga sp. UC242_53 TaxID=3350170 RepID=UPI0036D41A3C